MRMARVFTPRSARKLSNGPAIAPTEFCRKPSCSRHSAWRSSAPTMAMPPMMSEWPFKYLVVECTTMSKPCSSGRCTSGLAKVLSATAMMPRARQMSAMAAQVGQLQHRVGRRFDPHHLRFRAQRGQQVLGIGQVDIAELVAGRAPAHALEQPVGAAVHVVAGDDVAARVEQFQHGRDGRQARGEGEGRAAAFQVGHAALERPARGIVRAAIVEALVHAGAVLHEGGGGVNGRHDGARRRVGRLAGVDDARGEAALAGGFLAQDSVLRKWLRRSKRVIRP